MNDRVSITIQDHVADVRLNRPDKMNALDPAMFEGIVAAGERLRDEKGVRAVVLSGEGRAFCAGLDMASMASGGTGAPLIERTHGTSNLYQKVAMIWRELPMPVIAAVHGICFGGGLQIASGADMRIVSPETLLSIMEMKWGLVPDMGGYALWRRNVREDVLRRLTFTNAEFNGREAVEWGFATEVQDAPLERAKAIAATIADRNPQAMREAKTLFNGSVDLDEAEILQAESDAQARVIRQPNQIEAVMSQMEKRAANWKD